MNRSESMLIPVIYHPIVENRDKAHLRHASKDGSMAYMDGTRHSRHRPSIQPRPCFLDIDQ